MAVQQWPRILSVGWPRPDRDHSHRVAAHGQDLIEEGDSRVPFSVSTRSPVAGDGILVTRPVDAATRTADRLRILGATPVVAPFLRILERPAIVPPVTATATVVTSGNALSALSRLSRDMPILAVGDATAALAVAAGFTDVRSADGDAGMLVALAERSLRPDDGPVLLASGAGQGGPLAAALRARGFAVLRRTTYRAAPPAVFPAIAGRAIEDDALRAALFYSAETAAHFVRLLPAAIAGRLGEIDAVAIGEAAAARLAPLRWRRIRVAMRPTETCMLALV